MLDMEKLKERRKTHDSGRNMANSTKLRRAMSTLGSGPSLSETMSQAQTCVKDVFIFPGSVVNNVFSPQYINEHFRRSRRERRGRSRTGRAAKGDNGVEGDSEKRS